MHRRAWVLRRAAVVACVAFVVAACHRGKHYQANVEITRMTAVRKDPQGKVLTLDLEITYWDCPGTQIEVMRGDAEFAACFAKYKVGDRVNVEIDHAWASEGHYRWTVTKVGDCARVPDPNDEASYSMVRECSDWTVNGTRVGFECTYTPEKHLVAKCPWFRRH